MFPTTLPAFLRPSSGLLNASKILMFTKNCSPFLVWEVGRCQIDKFVRLMEMAGAINSDLFGTRMGRILD